MTAPTALVIGGTGPTGPGVVDALLDRGFEVTALHRGVHELPELADVEHLHADPHFAEPVRDAVAGREFDVVAAMYGRTRLVAQALAGRCDRFIGVGGLTLYEAAADPSERFPTGMRVLAGEDSPLAGQSGSAASGGFVSKMVATEREVFALHGQGAFAATWLRYAMVYGPRTLVPWEWSVVKRVLDGRRHLILPDAGLSIRARVAAANATALLMRVIDQPNVAAGQVFNVSDETQFSLRQWCELVAAAVGGRLEIVSLPWRMARPAVPLFPYKGTGSHHTLVSIEKAKTVLGHRDVVEPAEAVAASARWFRDNPVTPDRYPNLADRFDYAWEDAIIAGYNEALIAMSPLIDVDDGGVMHDYPHPKVPGGVDAHGR